MANSYFNWPASLNRFVPLDTARADDVNDAFDALSAGLDEVSADIASAIKISSTSVSQEIPDGAGARAGKVITFDEDGNVMLSENTYDSTLADAAAAQASAEAAAASAATAQIAADGLVQTADGVKDLFIAGTHYTSGVTTQLTLSQTPVKANAVKVFFDGVYQNKDTWSRVGNVITFNTALVVDDVEVQYEIPSLFIQPETLYLGAQASGPALDGEGNPLIAGVKYFNTTDNKMYVRNTSGTWQLDTADSGYVNFLPAGTGAVTTTVQSKLRQYVAANDFAGVDPTGATDSTVGLKAAFDHAVPLGKQIELEGNYLVSGSIQPYATRDSGSMHIVCKGSVIITVDPAATAFRELLYLETTAANNCSVTGGSLTINCNNKAACGLTFRHNAASQSGTVNVSSPVTVLNCRANDAAATYENQGIAVYGNYATVVLHSPKVVGVSRVNTAGFCKGITVSGFSGEVDIYSPHVENVLTPGTVEADGIAVFGKSIGTTDNARAGKATIHSGVFIDCQVRSVKSQCSDTTIINPLVKRKMVVSTVGSIDFDFQTGNGLLIEPRYEYRKNGATSPISSTHSCVVFQNKLDNMEMVSKSVGGVLLTEVTAPRYCFLVTQSTAKESTCEVSDLTVVPISGFTATAIDRGIIEFNAAEVVAKSTKTHFCVSRLRGPLSTYLIAYTAYTTGDLSEKLSYEVTDNTNTLAATAVGREFLNQSGNQIVSVESWTGRNNQGFGDLAPAGWTFNFNKLSEGCTFFVDLSTVVATNPPGWGASGFALIECLGSRTSLTDKSVRVTKDNADAANTVFYTRNGGTTWGVIK